MVTTTKQELKTWRAADCLSVAAAAHYFGVSRDTYKRMELGQVPVELRADRRARLSVYRRELDERARRREAREPSTIDGYVLRAWRELNGFTQTAACRLLGASLRAYKQFESWDGPVPHWVEDVVMRGAHPIYARAGTPEQTPHEPQRVWKTLPASRQFYHLTVPHYPTLAWARAMNAQFTVPANAIPPDKITY